MSGDHTLAVIHSQRQTETLFQIEHALRKYFELEAACLIANGEAYRREMKDAESHLILLLTRIGGKATLGTCTVSAHEAFEGERKIGAWFACHGPAAEFRDSANAMAHTRLLTPWKRGLLLEAPSSSAS